MRSEIPTRRPIYLVRITQHFDFVSRGWAFRGFVRRAEGTRKELKCSKLLKVLQSPA